MSDYFVKAITDDLADAGFPLNQQQVDALVSSRKKATEKAREEIRNAVRAAMVKEGFGGADLQRAAKDMAQSVVNNTLSERKLQDMVDATVQKMLMDAIAETQRSMPNGSTIAAMIKGCIEKEAARLAQQYIHKNIVVSANEAGAYKDGGTF